MLKTKAPKVPMNTKITAAVAEEEGAGPPGLVEQPQPRQQCGRVHLEQQGRLGRWVPREHGDLQEQGQCAPVGCGPASCADGSSQSLLTVRP